MAILREREVRSRPVSRRSLELPNRLSPDEEKHVRAALRVLQVRFGGWAPVAAAMGVRANVLLRCVSRNGRPSAGLAVRTARLAKATIEDVLSGAWPAPGSCPMCGRCD